MKKIIKKSNNTYIKRETYLIRYNDQFYYICILYIMNDVSVNYFHLRSRFCFIQYRTIKRKKKCITFSTLYLTVNFYS